MHNVMLHIMYMYVRTYACVYIVGNTGLSLPKSAAAQQASNDWQPNVLTSTS